MIAFYLFFFMLSEIMVRTRNVFFSNAAKFKENIVYPISRVLPVFSCNFAAMTGNPANLFAP